MGYADIIHVTEQQVYLGKNHVNKPVTLDFEILCSINDRKIVNGTLLVLYSESVFITMGEIPHPQ